MYDLKALTEKREELLANIDALMSLAKKKNRDLTDDEADRCQQWMSEARDIEENKLPAAKEFQQLKKKRLEDNARDVIDGNVQQQTHDPLDFSSAGNDGAQTQQPNRQSNFTGQQVRPWNAVPAATHSLCALDDQEQALALGMFLRACAFKDEDSRRQCKDMGIDILRGDDGMFKMDARSKVIWGENAPLQSMQNIATTNADGGYLVPTLLASMILKVVDRWILARQISRVFPMQSENVDLPKWVSGLTISKPGLDTAGTGRRPDETTAIVQSDVEYDQVQLRAADAFTLTRISNRLLRENVISAADQVVEDGARAISKQMDYEFLVADGTTLAPDFSNTGLVTGLDTTGKKAATSGSSTDWSAITTGDLSTLMAALPDRFYQSNGQDPRVCFVCSRAFYHLVFERLMISKSFGKTDVGGMSPQSYSGYPIYFSEHMPKSATAAEVVCLFGNFYESSVTGIRQDVSVAMSEHRYFESDMMAVRVKASWHVNNHRDGTSGDGYVGLLTAV